MYHLFNNKFKFKKIKTIDLTSPLLKSHENTQQCKNCYSSSQVLVTVNYNADRVIKITATLTGYTSKKDKLMCRIIESNMTPCSESAAVGTEKAKVRGRQTDRWTLLSTLWVMSFNLQQRL